MVTVLNKLSCWFCLAPLEWIISAEKNIPRRRGGTQLSAESNFQAKKKTFEFCKEDVSIFACPPRLLAVAVR